MRNPILLLQELLPQPWVASTFGRLARSERPWLRELLIRAWMRVFDVSLEEAARHSTTDYQSFEDFFTRELRPGARPMPADSRVLVAPADGFLREFGALRGDMLVQAKGIDYSLGALLDDVALAEVFRDGWYASIYLSPGDYHRVHAPTAGVLRHSLEIPGRAYSVTPRTETSLPDLYCRNERLACVFDTPHGPLALVMVGAYLVAGIETVWRPRAPMASRRRNHHDLTFRRGGELGRFALGSTVVLVVPAKVFVPWSGLRKGERTRVGALLGTYGRD